MRNKRLPRASARIALNVIRHRTFPFSAREDPLLWRSVALSGESGRTAINRRPKSNFPLSTRHNAIHLSPQAVSTPQSRPCLMFRLAPADTSPEGLMFTKWREGTMQENDRRFRQRFDMRVQVKIRNLDSPDLSEQQVESSNISARGVFFST